jgi:hypothetical protein
MPYSVIVVEVEIYVDGVSHFMHLLLVCALRIPFFSNEAAGSPKSVRI